MKYDICFKNSKVGTAIITSEGLYNKINCSCSLPEEKIYRIQMTTDQKSFDLGICVPTNGVFKLQKAIPMKETQCNNARFEIITNEQRGNNTFIPLAPDKPFHHPENLTVARFAIQGKTAGVYIDNDQSACE